MKTMHDLSTRLSRRAFLGAGALGLGSIALAALDPPRRALADTLTRADRWAGIVDPPHFVPRAKRIIYLYMAGGPSQFESFDYKPKLAQLDGQPIPESFTAGQPIAQLQNTKLVCMRPQYDFARYGESGQEISSLFPHTARIADQLCIIRSMQTEQINHNPAHVFMNTGGIVSGRPSMGAWMLYGLGSESDDLPGYVVLQSTSPTSFQPVPGLIWQSGFLDSRFGGVQFESKGDSVVHYLNRPAGVSDAQQRDVIAAIRALNEMTIAERQDDEIAARISQYETAARMQASVPDLGDLSREPQAMLDLYGTDGRDNTFAANCLMARRLVERGVRFVQVCHNGWDHHAYVRRNMPILAEATDRASAALVIDLQQRGLLDDTLVIWGGEFGRTPMAQFTGRDHHIRGFSMWLAGGGIQRGVTYGSTDELGYFVAENPVHVHDLHATILQLMGIDHLRLTYPYRGRDFRLTDVAGEIVHGILA